jgi:hypothetical protein
MIARQMIEEVRADHGMASDVPLPKTLRSNKCHSGVTAEELSERWMIGLTQAQETIRITTQNGT